MDTYGTKTSTNRPMAFNALPISPWTLRFADGEREAAYSRSQFTQQSGFVFVHTGRTGRLLFSVGYLLVWTLVVLTTAGGYGLENLSKDMCITHFSILGLLGLLGLILWTIAQVERTGRAAFVCYPLMFLWAVACYSLEDERFSVRLVNYGFSGSMTSCAIPCGLLFLLLPEAICNRFCACLATGLTSVCIIAGFQVAGVRVNSGLVDSAIYLLLVLWTCWKTYAAEQQQRLVFCGEISHFPMNIEEVEMETWGIGDDCGHSESDGMLKKLRETYSILSGVASLTQLHIRDRVKSAMLTLLEIGKDLSAFGLRTEATPTGIMAWAVDSEYRRWLEERFLPVPLTRQPTNKPKAHAILYGSQELAPMLNQLEKNWNFDMFFLAQISGLRPLEVTGEFCVKKYALDTNLQLSETRVLRFFQELERKYKPNPYHNSTHAADVLNSLLFLYKQSDIFKEITELELFGSIIAALGHDVGHPAFSNRYLITTKSSFALICTLHTDNDVSVLEMMHAALTYELLNQELVLEHFSREHYMAIRRIITEMILATDMMKHFELVDVFKKKYAGRMLPLTEFEDKLALYKMCVKCADIAHAAKAVDLHEKWTMRVVEEFFHQGDLERDQGLPISMFCDRLDADLPKNQSGFIVNVVKPLFLSVNAVVRSPTIEACVIAQMDTNLEHWKRRAERKKRSSVAPNHMYTPRAEEPQDAVEHALTLTEDNL